MAHNHSWKQWTDSRYYCVHPTCYLKLQLELLDGKLSSCPKCGREFLINIKNVTGPIITCEFCNSGDETLTIDGQKKLIAKHIEETMEANLATAKKQLQTIHTNLSRKEKELNQREETIVKREYKLQLRQSKFREWFRAQKLALRKQKPAQSIPDLPEGINILDLVERQLKQ